MNSDRRQAASFILQGRRIELAFVGILSFLGGLMEAAFLVVVTRIAFAISEGADTIEIGFGLEYTVRESLAALSILLVARVSVAITANWAASRIGASVVASIRMRMSSSFIDASFAYQQSQKGGSLQELLTRLANEAAELFRSVSMFIVSLANLLAMITLAILVDPAGALVIFVMVGVLGTLLRPLRALLWRRSQSHIEVSMSFATALNEISQLGMEIQVFNVQDEVRGGLSDLIRDAESHHRRRSLVGGLIPHIYTGLAYGAMIGALAVVTLSDTVDLESLGAVMLVMLRSLTYGQAVQGALGGISSFGPSVTRLQEELLASTSESRESGGLPLPAITKVSVEGVSFSYLSDQDVLRDISFTLRKGETVGMIGPSGGGKSTLVHLMLGLRQPDRGRVTLDGQDLQQFSKDDFARRVTFVPQEPHLISGTVEDNIRFFRTTVDSAAVHEAARLAHLHDEIMAFPDKYDHRIGEGGGRLSGGQAQRLCIARALVESPDLLILDEPTSALDMRSEDLIRTTLLGLKGRVTIIIIAHRLSTLEICDRIMVLQSGRMVAFGTPEHLEAENAFYQEALEISGMR